MNGSILYLADRDSPAFRTDCTKVDVVCAGDSITGWNNYGGVTYWPYRTYPEFLRKPSEPSGLILANGGIAGEISQNGIGQVQEYYNDRLAAYCEGARVPLVDICSKLRDEHFADELHPNEEGARIIAGEVSGALAELGRHRSSK